MSNPLRLVCPVHEPGKTLIILLDKTDRVANPVAHILILIVSIK